MGGNRPMSIPSEHFVCPFFEGKDRRCAKRFNLQQLSDVFDQCLDAFEGCRIYQQLTVGESDRPGSDARAA